MRQLLPWVALLALPGCPRPDDDPTGATDATDVTDGTDSTDATDDTDDTDVPGPAARPTNERCVAFPRPPVLSGVRLERVWPNVSASLVTTLTPHPDGGWVATERRGRVLWWPDDPSATATVLATVPVDSSDNEEGLLGFAFHPDYAENNEVLLSYTTSPGGDRRSVVTRVQTRGDKTLDLSTESTIISVRQPAWNHNGGHIAFGPDDLLYIGLGDGGGGGDPYDNGQDPDTLLGALLRIDVDSGSPYAIPADNPFVGGGGAAEIYAWGLRNPWKFSFDRATGDLWLADVGQNRLEEIDLIKKGGNYGWNSMEGTECYIRGCDPSGLELPVAEYGRSLGKSITGGVVYRGSEVPSLVGNYLYGDFAFGRAWRLFRDVETGEWTPEEILPGGSGSWSTFALAPDGEAVFVDYGGRFYELRPTTPDEPTGFPTTLSATGCTDPADVTQPDAGLIPYSVAHPFWSDGADKDRWLAIPDERTIDARSDGQWILPVGSVVVKNFARGGERLSTRLMVHHNDGWAGYTYRWRPDGSDADYVVGGSVDAVSGGDWHFPGTGDCATCHTEAAGFTLGLESIQMATDHTYDNGVGDQIEVLSRIGVVQGPGLQGVEGLPDRDAAGATVPQRARAWLHSNCASCHQPGTTGGDQDWRWQTALPDTAACNEDPVRSDLGISGAKLVAPGAPERSVLLARLRDPDLHRMPPLGSLQIDTDGADLIEAWIRGLAACDVDDR